MKDIPDQQKNDDVLKNKINHNDNFSNIDF